MSSQSPQTRQKSGGKYNAGGVWSVVERLMADKCYAGGVWTVSKGVFAGECYGSVSVERRGESRVAANETRPNSTCKKLRHDRLIRKGRYRNPNVGGKSFEKQSNH